MHNMLQTTNHRIVRILLEEGANYICNGDYYNTANILSVELNITLKESKLKNKWSYKWYKN